MTDVRTLLKAKRQESRVSHQYASYNATGQLKCLACGTLVKHASAWEGHLGTKGHRSSVARLREIELKKGKGQPMVEIITSQGQVTKLGGRNADETNEIQAKRRRLLQPPGALPTGSHDPAHSAASDTDQAREESLGVAEMVESEYREFQREMLKVPDSYEVYEHASVAAEPQLFTERSLNDLHRDSALESMATDKASDEDRKGDEERQSILDRLLDEERAQEEADMRVNLMKKRLEAAKKLRLAQRMSDGK